MVERADHLRGPEVGDVLELTVIGENIASHWKAMDGAPGSPVGETERVTEGFRVRYQSGAIYQHRSGQLAGVYGAIGAHYDELGGPDSWLGLPTADEAPFLDDGRVSTFDHGAIYWWPDVGAIELKGVAVQYTGLICFGEEDNDQTSGSDEPYVILSVASPAGTSTTVTQVYQDVDDGESRPDLVELYRGDPTGLVLNVVLMEQDLGDPNAYRSSVEAAVKGGSVVLTAAVGAVPGGASVAVLAAGVLEELGPAIVDAVNSELDTGDDHLGTESIVFTAKDMVVLAARTTNSQEKDIGFKRATSLLSAQGASYKVYFGVTPI